MFLIDWHGIIYGVILLLNVDYHTNIKMLSITLVTQALKSNLYACMISFIQYAYILARSS